MTLINYDFLFFVNFVSVFLITVSCLKISYRWYKRKLLAFNFITLGIVYPMIFIFLSYWNYTNSLFLFVIGTTLLCMWTVILSIATFLINPSKKTWLNYAPLIYIIVPFIYFYSEDIKLTLIQILDLTGFIVFFAFLKVIIFGKKIIKFAGIFGLVSGLVSIFYTFAVLMQLNMPVYSSLFINVFMSLSFISFWYISTKSPDHFFYDYTYQKDRK